MSLALSLAALDPAVRRLLALLVNPSACRALDLAQWDKLVRVARASHLLGTLAARLASAGHLNDVPAPVARHLTSALQEARFLRKMAELEVDAAGRALAPLAMPLVLVKGAGYIATGLPLAEGRFLRDVDVLVPAARIDEAERALLAAGWAADEGLDDYDRRYYREWSHQIPPLRRANQPLELDVHHTILPPTGRIRPDAAALLRDARPLVPPWSVLATADQVVHASVHLFQDSDCTSRLRDVVDVDALCRHHAAAEHDFWPRLAERARAHQALRPLAYALTFARAWLDLPVDPAWLAALEDEARTSAWVTQQAALSLPPPDPDRGRSRAARRAARRMLARSLWLRMPPSLLAYHGAMKAWRTLTRRAAPAADIVQP